jgi:hypothetical protein
VLLVIISTSHQGAQVVGHTSLCPAAVTIPQELHLR